MRFSRGLQFAAPSNCNDKKWCESLDKGGGFGAWLTDLSNAFDCLPDKLLIGKLDTNNV